MTAKETIISHNERLEALKTIADTLPTVEELLEGRYKLVQIEGQTLTVGDSLSLPIPGNMILAGAFYFISASNNNLDHSQGYEGFITAAHPTCQINDGNNAVNYSVLKYSNGNVTIDTTKSDWETLYKVSVYAVYEE